MAEYSAEKVKEYLENYRKMIGYYHELYFGASAGETINKINEVIKYAKNSFPEELKGDNFNEILSGLEKIVKGKAVNSE